MVIQGRMMEIIRELIGERGIKLRVGGSISQSKQTDLGIPQGRVFSVVLFLVAINEILRELGKWSGWITLQMIRQYILQQEFRE